MITHLCVTPWTTADVYTRVVEMLAVRRHRVYFLLNCCIGNMCPPSPHAKTTDLHKQFTNYLSENEYPVSDFLMSIQTFNTQVRCSKCVLLLLTFNVMTLH